MRAPFQILAIPYRIVRGQPMYCVFHRADFDQWQFIAGGGEDDETPVQAVKREISEEGGVIADTILELKSMCYIPTDIFPKRYLYNWPEDTYVVPEYAFGFECADEIQLSHEHTECVWLPYADARAKLRWDSNRTALYELDRRLSENENITYQSRKDLPSDQLAALFAAVGWSDETKELTPAMLANFNKPFLHSTLVFSAWEEDQLIGCVRVLSDTIFRSVIFDLAVLPDYQKRGIGSELVRKCIAVYPDSEWSLETIPERVSFYEGLGFERNDSPVLKIPCKWF